MADSDGVQTSEDLNETGVAPDSSNKPVETKPAADSLESGPQPPAPGEEEIAAAKAKKHNSGDETVQGQEAPVDFGSRASQ